MSSSSHQGATTGRGTALPMGDPTAAMLSVGGYKETGTSKVAHWEHLRLLTVAAPHLDLTPYHIHPLVNGVIDGLLVHRGAPTVDPSASAPVLYHGGFDFCLDIVKARTMGVPTMPEPLLYGNGDVCDRRVVHATMSAADLGVDMRATLMVVRDDAAYVQRFAHGIPVLVMLALNKKPVDFLRTDECGRGARLPYRLRDARASFEASQGVKVTCCDVLYVADDAFFKNTPVERDIYAYHTLLAHKQLTAGGAYPSVYFDYPREPGLLVVRDEYDLPSTFGPCWTFDKHEEVPVIERLTQRGTLGGYFATMPKNVPSASSAVGGNAHGGAPSVKSPSSVAPVPMDTGDGHSPATEYMDEDESLVEQPVEEHMSDEEFARVLQDQDDHALALAIAAQQDDGFDQSPNT